MLFLSIFLVSGTVESVQVFVAHPIFVIKVHEVMAQLQYPSYLRSLSCSRKCQAFDIDIFKTKCVNLST